MAAFSPRARSTAAVARPAGPAPMMMESQELAMAVILSKRKTLVALDLSGRNILARADHVLHQLLCVGVGGKLLRDLSSAVHDDDAVCDRKRVGHDMGDKDHRHTAAFEHADELQHL